MKNYTFILIGAALIFFNIRVCPSQTQVMHLGDILWQMVIPDNPGTTNQDKQIRSLKQVSDINGDNINEIAVATGNYWTICLNGMNGNILWQFSTHFGSINTGSVMWEDAMDVADVNSDGILDVVFGCGGGNEMVYALNGLNGQRFWAYGDSTTTNDGDIESVKMKYDYNGDGKKDVLVSASGTANGGRHALICLNGINGQVIFYQTLPEPYTDDLVAMESGGAIGVNNNGAPYVVTGFNMTGATVWNYTAGGSIWSLKEIPDINSDGGKDILGLGGFTGVIFAITGNSGSQIWSRSLGSSNNGNIAILDDADGNGFADFIPSAPQSAFRVDTKTGNTIWSTPLNSSYLRGVDNLGDITGDTTDDIVIATQLPPRIVVLNGINGNILFDYSFGSTLTQRGDRASVLNDIDSNGVNEFLGGNREGRVICFYGGNGTITSVNSQNASAPGFVLNQNYPNPFNPVTIISYELPAAAKINLTVYDILGKKIITLVDAKQSAGKHEANFDAANLPGGIYFYTLTVAEVESGNIFRNTKRMIVLK